MRKTLPALVLFAFLSQAASGQTNESYGKPIAEIFTDFHVNFNDTLKHTGFDLNRAYLGWHFIPGGKISGKVIINIGSPDDLATGSTPRRYAYCREASLIWSDEKLTVSAGVTGTRIFEFQQRFWGKRYVANTYQSINGYGFIADLGFVIDYKFNDVWKADLSVMNGEGYSNLQLDDNLRASLGLTITPASGLAFRIYGDIQDAGGLWQPVAVVFAGYKNDLITIGGEISYKSNIDCNRGHHAWGVSSTGGINLTQKLELFGRYDYSTSVTLGKDIMKWNYLKDGSFVIIGMQYILSPYAKIALNYQGRYPYSPLKTGTDMIFLNALFKF
ncbi:MAG: hypothetical protein MUF36_06820 [Bacteroidales bacterium]|jgi:hypothetical protein|nr:hypothetical protein [Bacteroidales bacterium]